ncbi:MAG: hypothetical protein MR016_05530 [Agathobacter sp.]|nr:hypothetical protein [Agathobacter sp.]
MKKEIRKKIFTFLLAASVLIPLFHTMEIQAAATFTKADFDVRESVNSSVWNLMDAGKNYTSYKGIYENNSKVVLVNKNIHIGSTYSEVKKAFGKTKKREIDMTEPITAEMQISRPYLNLKNWSYYLNYKCADEYGKNHYLKIYFDADDKIDCMIFHSEETAYVDELYKSNYKFIAPKGKKITTKEIDGKTVYMLPKGTKIKFNSKDKKNVSTHVGMYDDKNRQIAFTYYEENIFKNKTTYKASALIKNLKSPNPNDIFNPNLVDYKELGDYKYFALELITYGNEERLIPELVYFKFK